MSGVGRRDFSVAIAGAGSIGVAFAVLFARADIAVRVWDPFEGALERAAIDLQGRFDLLCDHGLSRDEATAALELVTFTDDLGHAVEGAALVQECIPEDLELKRELFEQLGELTSSAVLASSSSAYVPSSYSAGLACSDRVLGGHPGNPPYLIPVIELVPSPNTSTDSIAAAEMIYVSAGLSVVRVNHEPDGFIFNRLQGALLREAYCLVRDGVASVEDVDEVVRSGLGRRWCFMGPFETVDLNTRGGIEVHADRMGPAYQRMGAERGQEDPWTPDLVAEVVRQRRTVLPLDQWEERVAWRDDQLMSRLPQQ